MLLRKTTWFWKSGLAAISFVLILSISGCSDAPPEENTVSETVIDVQAIQEEISRTASMNKIQEKSKSGMSHFSIGLISAVITALILGIIGVFVLMNNPFESMFSNEQVQQETTVDVEWTGPTVPNYVGQKYSDVLASAESDSNLKIYRTFEDKYSDQYEKGVIIEQFPATGAQVTENTELAITVVVSKGSQMLELPEVNSKKLDDVAETLGMMGFIVTAEYQYSDEYAKDRVISYKNYQPGDKVEDGSEITIVVSKGTEEAENSDN